MYTFYSQQTELVIIHIGKFSLDVFFMSSVSQLSFHNLWQHILCSFCQSQGYLYPFCLEFVKPCLICQAMSLIWFLPTFDNRFFAKFFKVSFLYSNAQKFQAGAVRDYKNRHQKCLLGFWRGKKSFLTIQKVQHFGVCFCSPNHTPSAQRPSGRRCAGQWQPNGLLSIGQFPHLRCCQLARLFDRYKLLCGDPLTLPNCHVCSLAIQMS